MTTETDIANRALQSIGTRTTITALTQNTNEAIQLNLVFDKIRNQLIRMAPWNCVRAYANLAYITSIPGTPENTTAGAALWAPGVPAPPWAYEYQYPVDCERATYIVPQFSTGWSSGVPITTAITGGGVPFWNGPPVKYQVSTDLFYPVTAAAVAVGGSGYAAGDFITLASGVNTSNPIGAPVVLLVLTAPGGVCTTVSVVNQIAGSATPQGGSYFAPQANPVAQGSTTGSGVNATFTLTLGAKGSQRVILTNQENALLCYNRRITDPNVMDEDFVEAWAKLLGAEVSFQLTGDTATANLKVNEANLKIASARTADGNEGLTVNDVTPDWIRVRGFQYVGEGSVPNAGFDWGSLWPTY